MSDHMSEVCIASLTLDHAPYLVRVRVTVRVRVRVKVRVRAVPL